MGETDFSEVYKNVIENKLVFFFFRFLLLTMEACGQSSKKNDVSGLTGLANLIKRKFPGYTRKEIFELIKKVRERNSGKLVGLKLKKFLQLV